MVIVRSHWQHITQVRSAAERNLRPSGPGVETLSKDSGGYSSDDARRHDHRLRCRWQLAHIEDANGNVVTANCVDGQLLTLEHRQGSRSVFAYTPKVGSPRYRLGRGVGQLHI